MKIKYVWYDEPDVEKVYDTEAGYREHVLFRKFLHYPPYTKQEWDDFEKQTIEDKRKQGLVLRYEIVEE